MNIIDIGLELFIVLFLASIIVGVLFGVIAIFFQIPSLKNLWHSIPRGGRQWVVYQYFGLSLLGVIIFALHFPITIVMELDDWAIDKMMWLYKENIPSIEARKIPPFVLLDIDNKTIESWGENSSSISTPRDQLKNLIDTAVKGQARLILVDIDISQSRSKSGPLPDDMVLAEYLKNYAALCKQNQSACSPIILVRGFNEVSASDHPLLLTPDVGFFDEVVRQSFPYVQWGSARFNKSNATGIMRRWSLWEATCTNEQQPGVIPSMALLTMDIIIGCGKYGEKILNTLDSVKPENCHQFSPPQSIKFCGFTANTNIDSVEQRIMYRMPYTEAPENNAITVHDKQGNTVLTILSAKSYAEESLPADRLEVFNHSVVVIGGSFGPQGFNDKHETPIGIMPGALVIINAIHALLQDLTIKPASYLWLFIAVMIIITLFSWIPEKRDEKTVTDEQPIPWYKTRGLLIFIIFSIVVGLVISSVILFEEGTWLDIAVPLLLIYVVRMIYQLFGKIYQYFQMFYQTVRKIFKFNKIDNKVVSTPSVGRD